MYQRRPALIPQLKKIKFLAAGGNHIQALDHKGNVFAWGAGEQSQLGRRIVDRNRAQALTPCQFGLPKNKITYISCGAYHSFAIDVDGHVYAWGLSNFGQTGITNGAGESDAFIEKPTIIESLEPYKIREIKGGNHHSIASTEEGELLVWGRCDDAQAGIILEDVPQEDLIFDSRNKPRILMKPTVIPGN
jgi:regulator of chromosome condensation